MRYVLMILGALVVGVSLFFGSYFVVDLVWTHLVVTNPRDLSDAHGVVVVLGWLALETSLAFQE